MNPLLYIDWNVDPDAFVIPFLDRPVRWYGIFFALAFICSQFIMGRVYKTENRPQKHLDILTLYIILGTVLGARLGHCLFYNPSFYLSNPIEIIKIWEGGLASHGSAIGIITAMWLYTKRTGESLLWIMDRIVLVVPLSGMFIRLGNLMNSEIVGKVTDVSWGFKFQRNYDDVMAFMHRGIEIPVRHAAQLYEAIYCLFLTILMMVLYAKKRDKVGPGFMFGLFCVVLFVERFADEFLKEPQEGWEKGLPVNMGQILSIPFILIGIYFMWKSTKKTERLSA